VSRRARLKAYGSAALAAVAGSVCAAVAGSLALQAIGYTALGLGLGAIVLLIFYEVGLSEDRERAAEEKRRRP
jgi:hypothetical protein